MAMCQLAVGVVWGVGVDAEGFTASGSGGCSLLGWVAHCGGVAPLEHAPHGVLHISIERVPVPEGKSERAPAFRDIDWI